MIKKELIPLPEFRRLVDCGGVSEFGIIKQAGTYYVFALNNAVGRAYYLREARGGFRGWSRLDRAGGFLEGLGVKAYTVKLI